MQTRSLDHARLTVVTSSFVSSSPIPGSSSPAMRSARVPIITRVVARGPAMPQGAVVHTGDFGRGFAWALMIEATAALLIFAAWHFWRAL
ncbi:MAG: hypothetical protein ACRD3S_01290 [Terracidiphilus sp.]